jgi:hypothetical protein
VEYSNSSPLILRGSGDQKVNPKVSERHNTIVCIFDHGSPRITAFYIHEWVYDTLRLEEDSVLSR